MCGFRMIPVSIVTADENGETVLKKELFVDREMFIPLDTSKPFKLNSETTGFCAWALLFQPLRF